MKHLVLFLTLLIGNYNYSQTFNEMGVTLPQLSFSISAFGDYDNDGDLDVFLSGMDAGGTIVGGLYIYDTDSYTLSTTAALPAVYMGAAAWGDIDNDGDLDIVIIGQDATYTDISTVFVNNNDGSFTTLSVGLTPIEQGDVAFSDFNNDTYLDISITGIGSAERVTKLYKNNGDNTFSELSSVILPGMNNGEIDWADYNNDNFPDFILSGFDDNTGGSNSYFTKIFTNKGDETFADSGISLHQGWLGDIEWGDYNADGNVDLVISGVGGDGTERYTLLYKNNGDGSFTELDPGFTGVSHSSLEWADFDGDADLDLFITGTTTTPGDGNNLSTIYINNGNDLFTNSGITTFNASYYGDADTGDIDGDGKIDLIITGYDEIYIQKTAVYSNDTNIAINDFNIKSFDFYPNPTTDKKISIVYDFDKVNTTKNELNIYTLNGRKIFHKKLKNNSSFYKQQIELSNLKEGMYLLQFKSGDRISNKKLILK